MFIIEMEGDLFCTSDLTNTQKAQGPVHVGQIVLLGGSLGAYAG